MSERHGRKLSTVPSPNVMSYSGCNEEESTRNRIVSSDSFFRRNGFLKEFGSDSESEDNEESVEERTKVRALTEIERLEEAQTALENRVKHVRELLRKRDRTRNQRIQGQRTLERLEAKLDMLDQRLEHERAGKNRWTFVKRVLRKPKVGFHSSELLNRKVPLRLLAASMDTEPELDDSILTEQESNTEEVRLDDGQPPPKPTTMFKTRELQNFHLSLEETETGAGPSEDGNEEKADLSEQREDNTWLMDDGTDSKEMDKGWLRISDRPKDFIKKIDASQTHQSKEAWVNINEKGHQIFARKVFRSHMNGRSSVPSRSLDERNPRSPYVRQNGTGSLSETYPGTKDKNIERRRVGRVSSSRSQRSPSLSPSPRSHLSSRAQRPHIVKMESVVGTTSFLPPIPKHEAKKRPKQEQVDKFKDENDEEQKKERIILLPNRKRVARRRAEMYLRQLEFVKSHGLDTTEVLKNVGSAIEEHLAGEEEVSDHEAKSTPRKTLFLIGALSREHLYTPTTLSES